MILHGLNIKARLGFDRFLYQVQFNNIYLN
nr:MAG TPA: hypothetical protein [Bacteriophage sp.]